MITIRELADSCNISVRTLQYYDQIDLLKPSGYQGRIRLYDEAAKKKLKCILAWKATLSPPAPVMAAAFRGSWIPMSMRPYRSETTFSPAVSFRQWCLWMQ